MNRKTSFTTIIILSFLILIPSALAKESNSQKPSLLAGPKAIAGAVTGVAIGVPVNITKSTKRFTLGMHDSISQNFSFADESDIYTKTMATILAVPYGLVSGITYGTIKGFESGILKGAEQPFSKESFSLKE